MKKLFTLSSTAIVLFAFAVCLQSCNEHGVQLEKQKVQFAVNSASFNNDDADNIELASTARARMSVASSNGVSLLTDHEVSLLKTTDGYVTDYVELTPGSYSITDFVIVDAGEEMYLTPKRNAEFITTSSDALPYHFSVKTNNVATLAMGVIDVRNQDIEKFGYTSAKAKSNTLSIAVYDKSKPGKSFTRATLEVRQNKKLVNTFQLNAHVNTITLSGDPKQPYTFTAYTTSSAKTQTFDLTKLKLKNGKNILELVLEPALVLSIKSHIPEDIDYEDYFEFRMGGQGGVNINWGDGEESTASLPFEISHEYFTGNYPLIVTGDVHGVTDFSGFSYSTIITSITGLTNLTALKVYDPSWGAVPIKVDLSNCKKLQSINVAKYGAPYEPCDLRTEFKLPVEHFISEFIFDAPSFDITREYISAEELDVFVSNVYNNVVNRNIHNGKFFVNPVVTPSAATQQKLNVLQNTYNWRVGFNDDIYNAYEDAAGRSRALPDADAQREKWLRERFSNSERIIARAHVALSVN